MVARTYGSGEGPCSGGHTQSRCGLLRASEEICKNRRWASGQLPKLKLPSLSLLVKLTSLRISLERVVKLTSLRIEITSN